jgi:hypothetical protein
MARSEAIVARSFLWKNRAWTKSISTAMPVSGSASVYGPSEIRDQFHSTFLSRMQCRDRQCVGCYSDSWRIKHTG